MPEMRADETYRLEFINDDHSQLRATLPVPDAANTAQKDQTHGLPAATIMMPKRTGRQSPRVHGDTAPTIIFPLDGTGTERRISVCADDLHGYYTQAGDYSMGRDPTITKATWPKFRPPTPRAELTSGKCIPLPLFWEIRNPHRFASLAAGHGVQHADRLSPGAGRVPGGTPTHNDTIPIHWNATSEQTFSVVGDDLPDIDKNGRPRIGFEIELALCDGAGKTYAKFTNQMSKNSVARTDPAHVPEATVPSPSFPVPVERELWGTIDVLGAEAFAETMFPRFQQYLPPDIEAFIILMAVAVLEMNNRIKRPEQYPVQQSMGPYDWISNSWVRARREQRHKELMEKRARWKELKEKELESAQTS